MISLQSDVNALTYKAVPYKETTMQVSGGVLSVKNADPNLAIVISNSSGSLLDTSLFPDGKFSPGGLDFLSESGDISIALQNGAVVKWQSGGAVMLSEPRWFIDTSSGTTTMVITLIQVNSSESLAKAGISTVQMSIEPLNITPGTNIIDQNLADGIVKINGTLAEKYQKAWANYFEYTLGMTGPSPNWQKTGVDRIIIEAWKINIINI